MLCADVAATTAQYAGRFEIFDSKAGSLGKSKKDYLIDSQMVFRI